MEINDLNKIANALNELVPTTGAHVSNGFLFGTLPNGLPFHLVERGEQFFTMTSGTDTRIINSPYYACIAVAKEILGNASYKIVNGTYYSANTPDAVIAILEESRKNGTRLRLHNGDAKTGKDWMEEWDVTGRIGRSMGPIKIPLMIASGEDGGPGLLEDCIVRIRTASGNRELYRHPEYHIGHIRLVHDPANKDGMPYSVLINNENHANFKTEKQRTAWIEKMGITL